MTEKYQFN